MRIYIMKEFVRSGLIVVAFSLSGILKAQDSLIIKEIKANTYELVIKNGKLSGKGASIIKEAIR